MPDKKNLNIWMDFLAMSRRIGSDPMLIQGAGGNVSIKNGSTMFVKASGQWLCESEDSNIFIEVDIKTGLSVHSEESILRPSIETALHLALPHNLVVHTHSVNALSWLVRDDAQHQLNRLLRGMKWGWIPYVKPGKELAADIRSKFERESANVYLLQNHGVVLAANDVNEVDSLIREIECRLHQEIPQISPQSSSAIKALSLDLHDWRLPKYSEVHHLALLERSRSLVETQAMFPDQVIFLGVAPLVCRNISDINRDAAKYFSLHGSKPGWIILEGQGVVVPRNFSAGAEELLLGLARVVMRISVNSNVNYLKADSVSDLLDWDAEKYRQNLGSNT